MIDDELIKEANKSIANVLGSMPAHPKGLAIITDDDLISASYIFFDNDEESDERFFDLGEWQDGEANAFDEVVRLLAKSKQERPFNVHVESCFNDFVLAMLNHRASGLFAANVWLSVASSDPGPKLQKMEAEANLRLNNAMMVARHQHAQR